MTTERTIKDPYGDYLLGMFPMIGDLGVELTKQVMMMEQEPPVLPARYGEISPVVIPLEWNEKYWLKKVGPRQFLTPEDQEEIAGYAGQIVAALETQGGFSRTEGVSRFRNLYNGTVDEGRRMIILAMGVVIEEAQQHLALSAFLINFAAKADLTQIESSIRRLDQTPILRENALLERAIINYKESRILSLSSL